MATSIVRLNGTVLMSVDDTTAVPADVSDDAEFYQANGVKASGTMDAQLYTDNTTISGVTFYRQFNMVTMVMNKSITMTANTQFTIGTIPSGYRPTFAFPIVAQFASSGIPNGSARLVANSSGSLVGQSNTSGTYAVYCTASWATTDAIS